MLLDGPTNTFKTVVRQRLSGEGINLKTILFDPGVGALAGAFFHGAEKMVKGMCGFISRGFNKMASEMMENARIFKMATNNMLKGKKSVVLGAGLGGGSDDLSKVIKEFQKIKKGMKNTTNGVADSITKSEYSSLRKKTPSNDIRKMVNPEGTKIDSVYGYATDILEADHIVPMKEIVDMPGFTQLSREQQIEVLNLQDNFIGLGKSTNASKGAKNWTDWQGHSKLGEVPSDVRSKMLELESAAREALIKAIEARLKK